MSRLTLKEVKSRGRRAGALQTPLSKDWNSRLKGSENYFKDYSYDWEQSLTLLSGFKEMEAKWGHYISMAYAVTANLVNDVYFQNPKTFVQDKAGNKDLSAMLTDVFNSVARDTGLERHMKDAIFDNAWATYALSLRGHAGSEGHEKLRWTSIAEYVNDVEWAVAQIGKPPVIVGYSMGGFITQKYLETHQTPAPVSFS